MGSRMKCAPPMILGVDLNRDAVRGFSLVWSSKLELHGPSDTRGARVLQSEFVRYEAVCISRWLGQRGFEPLRLQDGGTLRTQEDVECFEGPMRWRTQDRLRGREGYVDGPGGYVAVTSPQLVRGKNKKT